MRKSLAFAGVLTLLFGWCTASAGNSSPEPTVSRSELRQSDAGRSTKPSKNNQLKDRCAGKVLNSDGMWVDTTTLVASAPYCISAL
jgi:hypothetical protein